MTGTQAAITAAALRLREGHARLGVRLPASDRRALAADMLEAAAPLIAAAERERCARLADAAGAICPLPRPVPAITVNGEPVGDTAGNTVIWPDGMPAVSLFGCLLREQS